MSKPRVLIADDHRIVVAGLEALLSPHYQLVGRAEDGRSLIELVRATPADFVVVVGLSAVQAMNPNALDSYSQLKEFIQRVQELKGNADLA